jgi:signal transduction histidine kinase
MIEMSTQLDIERQTRMRLMQEAADNAESSLATKRSFVRYVSHEIRTPLSVSMLGLDLIAEEVKALGAGESDMSSISDCQDSINIAVSILNDLLSYEKLESGILELQQEYVAMTGFIKKCLKPFNLQARQKNVTFIVEDETQEDIDKPFFINVDRTKMSQVIRNLASNAIKFTPPGGIVRVVLSVFDDTVATSEEEKMEDGTSIISRVVDIAGKGHPLSPKGSLQLDFIDSGVGISESNQGKVFQEIVQFSPNELQAGGGSGLGLWISRGIVELHEGKIGMTSEGIGHGSTFFVKLHAYRCDGEIPDIEIDTGEDSVRQDCPDFSTPGKDSALSTTQSPVLNAQSLHQRKVEMPKMGLRRTYSMASSRPSSRGSSLCSRSDDELENIVLCGLRILIVDDAAMIRKLLKRVLDAKGVICFVAEDGQDAIDKVQQLQYKESECSEKAAVTTASSSHIITPPSDGGDLKTFDVILMDFIMPVLDGPSSTKVLRQNGYKGMILGVTGNMMPSDVQAFEEAGANSVFAKPLKMNKLVEYLSLNLDLESLDKIKE